VWCHRQASLEFYTPGLIKCFNCSVTGRPWRHLLGEFRISKYKRIRTGFATNATDTRLDWWGWIQAEYTTGSHVYDSQDTSDDSAHGIWKMKRKKNHLEDLCEDGWAVWKIITNWVWARGLNSNASQQARTGGVESTVTNRVTQNVRYWQCQRLSASH